MSIVVNGKTANIVYDKLYKTLMEKGELVNSRNGLTKELTHVVTIIKNPKERWVTWRQPSISPAFAIAELVMLINGSDDADIINSWNRSLKKYQGKYSHYPGAYGPRLCNTFGLNQLMKVYETFSFKPESRQVVLQIWNPTIDLPQKEGLPNNLDIPCSLVSILKVRKNKLLWTQVMRSNDLFLGVPYDFIQFTFLHEIIAGWLQLEVGEYMHISDSLHLYSDSLNNNLLCKGNNYLYAMNTDSLNASYKDSIFYFSYIFEAMKSMVNSDNLMNIIKDFIYTKDLPSAYKNMLLVLCEYKILKHRLGDGLIQECRRLNTNSLYNTMMIAWGRSNHRDCN